MTAQQPEHLPVAEPSRVRRAAARLIAMDRSAFVLMIVLNLLGAAAGLVGPWLLGRIVDEVRSGAGVATIDRLGLALLAVAVAQIVLTRYARAVAHRFGERTAARVREQFVERALQLPTSVAERAGSGDLTTRGVADVQNVSVTLRDAGPDVLIAVLQAVLLFGAMFLLDPLIGACGLVGLIGMLIAFRWYLRRARAAYLAEGAAGSTLAELITTTASGARTIEAFGLRQRRQAACDDAIGTARRTRLRTLQLRSVLFPAVDVSLVLPMVGALLVGSVLLHAGSITVGAVVAGALYAQQLMQPLDTILLWTETIQSSGASFARIEGVAEATRTPPGRSNRPEDAHVRFTDVHFAYDGGPDVVHGINLTIRPGERLAVVGPSGAGKTTLGRLLAAVDVPRTGRVSIGGVPVTELGVDELRRHVVLVTQEHHVFLGTVRDNLLIARPASTDEALQSALATVGAQWVHALPHGLDTELGDGHVRLDGAQSEQLALARVVLANPHTVVLDEATALLDPARARHTERGLAAALRGRTVIAIAHRLHTARDADRIAVLNDGRLDGLGTHDELLATDGAYAALWRAWHGES